MNARKNVRKSNLNRHWINKFGIYGIAVTLLLVGGLISPKFFSVSNIMNVLDAISYLGILTAGMSLVTYSGQSVDLSTPSSVAVGGFTAIITLHFGLIPMLICVLLSGAIIGVINGLVIGKLRINTVVWTLAMSFILSGLIRVVFGSSTIYPTRGNTVLFDQISRFRVGGYVPLSILLMLLLFISLHILTEYSKTGVKMKLVGLSEIVAQYSGVNVERIILLCFVGSGLTAAITGLFIASLSRAACYNFGKGYEFDAITAIVLSGMLLDGGKGSMIGVFGGVLSIGLLKNIMTLLGLNTFIQDVITGAIFIMVIWVTNLTAKKMEAQNG